MKKITTMLIIMAFCLVTSGCIKRSYEFEIDKKDNISITQIEAFKTAMLKSFGEYAEESIVNQMDENKGKLEEKGYKVENYKDEEFTGLKINKKFSAEAMTKSDLPDGFTSVNDVPLQVKKGFIKNIYTLDVKFDFNEIANKEKDNFSGGNSKNHEPTVVSTSKTMDSNYNVTEKTTYNDGTTSTAKYNQKEADDFGKSLGTMFSAINKLNPVLDLTVKIPYKAKTHNATKVISDLEYRWDLTSDKGVEIKITYEKTNWLNIAIAILIGLIVLALIIKR